MDAKQHRALLAASVAGLLTAAASVVRTAHAQEMPMEGDEGSVSCYVPTSCAGKGDCGGKGHSCAGMSSCAGQGYVKLELDEDTCLRIQGGRLTAEPEPSEPAA